jgi:transposase
MKILAIDLGKNKSVFVDYVTCHATREGKASEHEFGKVATEPAAIHDLLVQRAPDRLVIEAGPAAGWVHDLAETLDIPIQVANANDQRWQWKLVKNKTDRTDALKLAQMSEMGCLPVVHMPTTKVRQWRSFIEYRHGLVGRRTMIKNNIRAIFERQGLKLPAGDKAWAAVGIAEWSKAAQDASAPADQLWRFQVHVELKLLEALEEQIKQVESKLAELAKADQRVRQLRTAPWVGPRLSEAVVTIIDDPKRFKSARQVSSYSGLTPRRWQSGESDRQGHISHAGNRLLRGLLVEVAWLGVRANTWMKQVYENVRRGSDKRKKIAIVAVARRLLVKLWAMLRDGSEWKDSSVPAALTT